MPQFPKALLALLRSLAQLYLSPHQYLPPTQHQLLLLPQLMDCQLSK